jgi:hypothetical protein
MPWRRWVRRTGSSTGRARPRDAGRTILYLVAGAIGFAVLSLIPYLGGLLVLVAIVTGAGAFLRVLVARLRQPALPAVAPVAASRSSAPPPAAG